jgi:NADH dehydrogenase
MKKEHVLIVGGGFGGVKAALELAKNGHFKVTLLTENDTFRYYPTLYRTATGGRRANSSIPLGEIFKDHRITIEQGKAVTLDRKAKQVITDKDKKYDYDTLILALGVVTNYFSIPGLSDFAYGIKSADDALKLKQHLHQQLTDEHQPDLNYLIVGAGPTGIELAGALPAYLKQVMRNHGIQKNSVNVRLIEAAPRLLPRFSKSTSRSVRRRQKRLDIKIHLGKVVSGQTADTLTVSGKPMKSHTVIWTAGVTNHPFFGENHFILMNRGKVATDVYLQTEPDIFVIGDNANTPYSGLAETAVHDGKFVAMNLKRRARGKDMKAYNPKAPISVIPVGKHWASVDYRKWHLHGGLGWLLREAADFVGFKDLESWPKAALPWTTEFGDEEQCETCAASAAR